MAMLELDENQSHYQIQAFKPGTLRINSSIYHKSLIVTPHKLLEDWAPQTFADLQENDFLAILALKPTLLLLGTGEHLQFPPASLYGALINAGIGVEIMDTAAACRTFSALSSENREVAAALVIA